jgi:outer membrane protein assembly factor BamB
MSISPSRIEPNTVTQFAAVVEGEAPFSYEWYFTATDMPAYSTEESPHVYMKDLGRHVCHLKVSNAHGQHTYYFAVLVAPTEYPPFILKLWPTIATANTTTQFFAEASGTEPLTWHWNFGGGAIPNQSNDAWPKVTLGQAGTYNASLTVTNALGVDTYFFTLTITPEAMPPVIERVWPTAVTANTLVQVYADVTGSEPLSYLWNFGSGATPNQTAEGWPEVVISSEGTYDCSLTVSNGVGEDIYNFVLDVALAQGDWSMFRHDPQHTGRSSYVGPQTASLNWKQQIGDRYGYTSNASIAVGADGTAYAASAYCLTAFNSNGSVKWRYQPIGTSSPAIGTDGTIYVCGRGAVYAINPEGSFKWRYQVSDLSFSDPTVGADGTIYVSGGSYVYAISPEGVLEWRYKTGGTVSSCPAIGQDGAIYFGSYDQNVYALNPDGTLKWNYDTGEYIYASPAIGWDGTVYIGGYFNNLYAINPDGTLKWRYETGASIYSSPAIGLDGTVYVGSYDCFLYAIDANGLLKWRNRTSGSIYSSPAIGGDGTIYVGSDDKYLYAFNPDGSELWSYKTSQGISCSPAIGPDGTVYILNAGNIIYAFNDKAAPIVVSIDHTMRIAHEDLTLSANVWGTEPLSYSWDFGGGATPNLSSEASPAITFGEPGVYNASLKVTNAFGEDTFSFDLTSIEPVLPGDWAMFGHDSTHSCRSSFVGPQTATVAWRMDTVGWLSTSPAIGADGTLYVGSGQNGLEGEASRYLYAINPDGTIKWRYQTSSEVRATPTIGAEGTIYVGDGSGLSAVNCDGTLKWRYDTEYDGGIGIVSGPAIGADGTIYAGDRDSYLYALNPDGSLKWRFKTGSDVIDGPVISPDGTIYVKSNDAYIYAISDDGSLKWRYIIGYEKGISCGLDGTVYVLDCIQISTGYRNRLNAISPDGTLKWIYTSEYLSGVISAMTPGIGSDGAVYASLSGYLYCINPDGTLRWHTSDSGYNHDLAIGADGTIYANKDYYDGVGHYFLCAVDADGTLMWEHQMEYMCSSPAISDSSTLYMGCGASPGSYSGYLYAFHD